MSLNTSKSGNQAYSVPGSVQKGSRIRLSNIILSLYKSSYLPWQVAGDCPPLERRPVVTHSARVVTELLQLP